MNSDETIRDAEAARESRLIAPGEKQERRGRWGKVISRLMASLLCLLLIDAGVRLLACQRQLAIIERQWQDEAAIWRAIRVINSRVPPGVDDGEWTRRVDEIGAWSSELRHRPPNDDLRRQFRSKVERVLESDINNTVLFELITFLKMNVTPLDPEDWLLIPRVL